MHNVFVDGFLPAIVAVVLVVALFSFLPVIPFLVKKKTKEARFYFWLIDLPISVALAGPMMAVLVDEGFAQVGWVFYFVTFPAAVLYYLIMVIYLVVKLVKAKGE